MTYSNITQNNLLTSVIVFLLLAASCTPIKTSSDTPDLQPMGEGQPFTTTISIDNSKMDRASLRSGGVEDEDQIQNLRVLVFDENHNFIYSNNAVLEESTDANSIGGDGYWLPEGGPNGINKIRKFRVSLLYSTKVRYVHFIANHDWTGFPQDYFAVGLSAGQFMNHVNLIDPNERLWGNEENKTKLGLWSRVETIGLNENTFKNRVVKLLRNYAKVTVSTQGFTPPPGESFELQEFTICNISDRGTIAPFTTDGYKYEFPFSPKVATKPVGLEIIQDENNIKNGTETPRYVRGDQPYYLFDKDNSNSDKRTFIIIKGIRTNTNTNPQIHSEIRYYKVDLVSRKDNASLSRYIPLIRNNRYQVNIRGILSDGYKTIGEAIDSPAGNNVFSDTKLKEFGTISDGNFTLSTSPIHRVVVRSGTYHFNVNYSARNGSTYLKYYPQWDVHKVAQNGEYGYEYTAGIDPYMGGLRKTETGFDIDVNAIPPYKTIEYTVEVVALRKFNGQPVDGITGATTPLTRTVHIILNAPLPFDATLESTSTENTRNLTFKVYDDDIIDKTLFPFEVLISADQITPTNTQGKNKLALAKITDPNTQKIKTYYRYMVLEEDQVRGKVVIPFIVNDPAKGPGEISLYSEFYRDQTITPDSDFKKYNIRLNYLDLQNNRKVIPQASQLEFNFEGQKYTPDEMWNKFKVSITPSDKDDGIYELLLPPHFEDQNFGKNLSITSVFVKNPAGGSVTYTAEAAMTLREWKENRDKIFDLKNVHITGRVYFGFGLDHRQDSRNYRILHDPICYIDRDSNKINNISVDTSNIQRDEARKKFYHIFEIDANAQDIKKMQRGQYIFLKYSPKPAPLYQDKFRIGNIDVGPLEFWIRMS